MSYWYPILNHIWATSKENVCTLIAYMDLRRSLIRVLSVCFHELLIYTKSFSHGLEKFFLGELFL